MKRLSLAFLALLWFPLPLTAQDARSMGMGFATVAVPMGLYGIVWNPSFLGMPAPDGRAEAWTVGAGFSALDANNTGTPILQYDDKEALDSDKSPARRGLDNQGVVAIRFINTAGGVVYGKSIYSSSSHDTLKFLKERDASFTDPSYSLDQTLRDRMGTDLVVGYGTPLPFGTIPVYVGANLKYHLGLSYEQTRLRGDFTPGSGLNSGFQYTRFNSTSGLGLSVDFGFFTKVSDTLQCGMMFENLKSDYSWKGTLRTYDLDDTTGADTPIGPPQDITLQDPFPYAIKLGISAAPPEKNIILAGEIEWKEGKTRWRGGLERYYPEVRLVVRLGTYADEISNEQIWCFGGGYLGKNFVVDVAFVTRSLPAVQDSIALGAAVNAAFRF
jgi:hypothetical protein